MPLLSPAPRHSSALTIYLVSNRVLAGISQAAASRILAPSSGVTSPSAASRRHIILAPPRNDSCRQDVRLSRHANHSKVLLRAFRFCRSRSARRLCSFSAIRRATSRSDLLRPQPQPVVPFPQSRRRRLLSRACRENGINSTNAPSSAFGGAAKRFYGSIPTRA